MSNGVPQDRGNGDAGPLRSATRVSTDAPYKLCIPTSKHLHRYMQHIRNTGTMVAATF